MGDEISISVSVPLDDDGFLRRECPSCELEFKWYAHEQDDLDAEVVDQYFCPLCGTPSGPDSWWTPAQIVYLESVAMPEIDRYVTDAIDDLVRGSQFLSVSSDGGLDIEESSVGEPPAIDDMTIVESPCHPHEPVKIPEAALDGSLHCLVCGAQFAA